MKRRNFLGCGLALAMGSPLLAALKQQHLDEAAELLTRAVASGQVAAATLHVTQGASIFSRSFGKVQTEQAMFLLGSISKPICMTALMTLYDRGQFKLDDWLQKFIPQFAGDGRERITMQHLLTHVSGLPDQLPENDALRKKHAPLAEFAEHAIRTPLSFAAGTRYQYSSMAILLASRVAEIISGEEIRALVERTVFQPLKMEHTSQGLGRFKIADMVSMQTDRAAPESGGGDASAKDWDWNSPYWRQLGAPWGGTHASASDLSLFLAEFLHEQGKVVKPETARLMVTNHNPAGITSRGLGFSVGPAAGSRGCSEKTFGHTGSTGTIAWADPMTNTTCVVLTSLPARAVDPHPRDLASARVATAMS